ncbi:MAG: Ni/Fe hydrogenase subunit alpha [Lentimicrobiaceae bacterium]|jgi:NAD-reducing hydrogenase large subunit|nr:Ni/Fe hydrogenase subunit alpha [Lentimicrobiaceae bacterium]MCP4909888.1 Ni/Fe hydrogenase subunit alpha [Bacteroidota bacterium]MBT3455092.1 Ni/Fe hydrogenase subunit alpha [Lentimicrobiaceae bacterium]MBT3818208.1 Ni/Fe hydrogenase subunit alpha [Lentimicrobiaceae bacterium]MBT4061754.1 Ni/Fe hydrogenase subunit alpha [Lentimicrobiaceae bacterium]
MPKKITIEPVTRVEGHGKVTIKLDDQGQVRESRLHIVEFRGFERFIQGRPYWEAPVLVQRLCGICPVSHHIAAAKALDVIVGAGTGEGLTAVGEKMRRLMHYGQFFQSHVLHFFHLSSPDFLFGINADPKIRNIIGVIEHHKDLAVQGVMMRKYGQEVIYHTAGKKIHGTGAIPGGINKNLSIAERDLLLNGEAPLNADQMVEWSVAAIDFFKAYHKSNQTMVDTFADFPSNHLSLVRKDGALDIYHGVLRAVDTNGNIILDDVDYQDYDKYIEEEVRNWSYMKFPYLKHIGKEKGWYRVGPLARMNTCDFIPTPLAQKAFEEFKAYTKGQPNNMTLHYHWARLIEVLHAAEEIRNLLRDPDLQNEDLVVKGEKLNKGVGVIEAPRGTLFHHYEINDNDQISLANLIVSTTNNNEPMNRAVNHTAKSFMNGQKEITEGMMNAVEVAIRAYDPCLSCATHALGQMPLEMKLVDSNDNIISHKTK